MSFCLLRVTAPVVILATFLLQPTQAQEYTQYGRANHGYAAQSPGRLNPAQYARAVRYASAAQNSAPQAINAPAPYVAAPQTSEYPQMGAPLYPAPVQNVPSQIGSTIITNQAFAPHEMLYPHEYHAVYPPFYHRVRGSWIWTPFGIRSHDKWELQGTEVKVKYRGNYGLLSGFKAPFNK